MLHALVSQSPQPGTFWGACLPWPRPLPLGPGDRADGMPEPFLSLHLVSGASHTKIKQAWMDRVRQTVFAFRFQSLKAPWDELMKANELALSPVWTGEPHVGSPLWRSPLASPPRGGCPPSQAEGAQDNSIAAPTPQDSPMATLSQREVLDHSNGFVLVSGSAFCSPDLLVPRTSLPKCS